MSPRTGASFDRMMMAVALRLAERGLGQTAPNPAVGAVICDETTGEIIARGWTQPGGRPHAETEAIRRAGERARGATIYVTLEPCSHYGRTTPCADAIVAAGLRRAVCGILDPDPRVSGRGMTRLRDAGIEVLRGVMAEEAHWITRGHILRVTERRPLIQLKMAVGADGTVPRGTGTQPVWVTSPEARAHGHLLRARADAILVGSGTVADDDPELTCRLPGLSDRSPVRIVLAGRRLPPVTSRLVRSAAHTPTWVFFASRHDARTLAELEEHGCRLFPITAVGGRPWLPAMTEAIVAQGITRLLVEGGPTIWRSFARAGFVDEIVCYRALDNGLEAGHVATHADLARLEPAHGFHLAEMRQIGADGLYRFRRT
ncbi:MAG: bifunctional diaminohydroxyphosphoribosylaminopyrimidine deaminase/5-amino-6-(5-phosphoribosylamino)uracil reductase RibD [Hyphomicrobiaceae bacterium]